MEKIPELPPRLLFLLRLLVAHTMTFICWMCMLPARVLQRKRDSIKIVKLITEAIKEDRFRTLSKSTGEHIRFLLNRPNNTLAEILRHRMPHS